MKSPQTVTQLVAAIPDRVLVDAFADIPDAEQLQVRIRAKSEALAGFGLAYHEAFDAANRGLWIGNNLYHFVRAEQQILARLGVTAVYTEWVHSGALRGTVDASLTGGPKRWGILENKIVGDAPPGGYYEDIAQVAAYCAIASKWGRPVRQVWAGLCYVLPEESQMRFLFWRDVRPLVAALGRATRRTPSRRRYFVAA